MAAPTAESMGQVARNVLCRHYDECLDVAILNDWEGFTCGGCELNAGGRASEDWLDKNTISCPLGRLTRAQCKRNRDRKQAADPVGFRDRSPEAEAARLAGIVRPSACEQCKDWKRLIAGLRKRANLKKSGREII